MYSYAETSGFGLSWLLDIVPFNIGPKYEFVTSLVQNSLKQEPHSRSNTIFDARTILPKIVFEREWGSCFRLFWTKLVTNSYLGPILNGTMSNNHDNPNPDVSA